MRISIRQLSRIGVTNTSLYSRNILSGAQIIYNKLKEKNVKDVFLYSGGSIMPLIDCFYQGPINYYINSHEQNCGHAATGYAKSSNSIGVVITTSGPGITNMITPILDAQNDSTPLVVISGQVGLDVIGTDAFQEAPATEITKPITKWSYCIQKTEEIPEVMDYAFYLANNGKKGAVHLDLPKCVATCKVDIDKLEIEKDINNYNNYFIEDEYYYTNKDQMIIEENYYQNLLLKVEEVASIINKSQKPIFYIGQGCSNAKNELKKNIYKNRIPCTSTIHGKGIFTEKDSLSLKWCGMHGLPAANYALQEADCIIAVGSRFDDRTTGKVDKYAPIAQEKKQIIHVDIEPKQFQKSVHSHYDIKCDARLFLDLLYPKLDEDMRLDWLCRIAQLKNLHQFEHRIPLYNKINTPMAISSINKKLQTDEKKDYHISTGVGNHQMMTYQFIDGLKPKKIHSSGSLGVMGAGLPYAVGIQIANPDSLVIDIDGDSSFMMTLGDLKTIRENNLPVKIAIMNDSRQMMVNIWERLFFEERYTATLNKRNPDFCALAESFGITSFKCSQADMLDDTTNQFLTHDGPALCEYVVEPEICLPLVGPGKALDEMVLFRDYFEEKNSKTEFNMSDVPS